MSPDGASSRPRFALRYEGPRSLLYDREEHAYHRLQALDAFLLVAARDVGGGAARALLAEKSGPSATDRAAVRLARLGVDLDALTQDPLTQGRLAVDVVELEPVEGAWAAPLVAHLGVTLACNFACSHCYSSSGKRAKDELSLSEIAHLVDELAAIGCFKLVLGGGEPFVRHDLPAIVQHAKARGVDVYIHTNASLLTEASLAALAEDPPANLSVSLDGADEVTNDRVRGPGAFHKAMSKLGLLRDHYPPGFSISFTVTPANAGAVGDVVELAAREGARLLLLRPAYPAGEALADPALVCTREVFSAAVSAARARAEAIGFAVDAPHPEEQGVPDFDGFGCVAGRVVLGITPTGKVTPCLNLPVRFEAGSVREASLLELWRAGHAFALLRAQTPTEACGTCRHYDTCRGGCRVRALAAGGDLDAPDSWCHYEPRDGVEAVATSRPPPPAVPPSRSPLPVLG